MCKLSLFGILILGQIGNAWDVDLSRRIANENPSSNVKELQWPSKNQNTQSEIFDQKSVSSMVSAFDSVQNIAILNTESGFVPESLRLRKDGTYRLFIVNVNEKVKNASFVFDDFGQNHGTYFGKVINFELRPKVENIFSFLCPETGFRGKVIVYTETEKVNPLAQVESEVKK